MNDARTQEIATSLAEVRERIRVASLAAQRAEPTLIVVTKTWPADDVRRLASLGVTDVGENRDQEAAPKFDATADLKLRWHMVGQLQRNKANHVARYADVVHALDRAEIVAALDRGAGFAERRIVGLIQVSLDGAEGRGGAAPEDVAALAEQIANSEHLDLGGVMAVAPLGADPSGAFAELVRIADRLRGDYPGALMISAGMSDDLEQAVAAGATHLRVGSSVLGKRSLAR
jgi:pyridoxal phosphate enzyme (YggS family)